MITDGTSMMNTVSWLMQKEKVLAKWVATLVGYAAPMKAKKESYDST